MNHIQLFYKLKPFIPRKLQLFIRRQIILWKLKAYQNIWPVDENAASPPDGWAGWPDQNKFALVLTHDVDTANGHSKCIQLAEIEKSLGFRSSFNFVPERYSVSDDLRTRLTNEGFEVGVHGLLHDGKLFRSKNMFVKRSIKINQYLKDWGAVGFRAPAMHHVLDWIHELNIEYDASSFDTDPFEPQSDGVSTIFPFLVQGLFNQNGYVEIPYTLPQDFTLFILMKEKDPNIWKEKLDWLVEKGGMALLNTHPDYMNFNGTKPTLEEYPIEYYKEFLEYVTKRYEGQYWHALPRDVANFWRTNMLKV